MDWVATEERLSPEAQRRRVLKEFGIEESWLKHLRKLDVDEAEWTVQHEHGVQIAFCVRRSQFILDETVNNRLKPGRRLLKPGEEPIIIQGLKTHSGSRLG